MKEAFRKKLNTLATEMIFSECLSSQQSVTVCAYLYIQYSAKILQKSATARSRKESKWLSKWKSAS